jgi:hypothetical protein
VLRFTSDDAVREIAARVNWGGRCSGRDWIGEAGRPNRTVVRGEYQRVADFRASATDLDASPMRSRGGGLDPGYHDHYVVDGGKARIILAALVTPAEVREHLPMLDLLWRVCFRWKLRPRQVTGDTTYGTLENIVAVEDAGIRAYVPLPDSDHQTAFFGRERYTYDPATDVYHCPGGQELRFRKPKDTERVRLYQAPAATGNACPLKTQCTAGSKGRQLKRSFDESYLDRVRGYHVTPAYQKAMRKRRAWVEPLFAEAKAWHGLRRFRLRGAGEGQRGGAADRGRAEPEAVTGRPGMGTVPVPDRNRRHRPADSPTPAGRDAVTALR